MAEPVGLASGLLALSVFAFQASVTLGETVKSFQSHQQRVQDLIEELNVLSGVLSSLTETVEATSGVDFSALHIPLLRCGNACTDFEKELFRCASRSGGSRTSFRNWARLKYMGEDVDGFRRLLAGYKMTVTIALADANLRKSSATAESIGAYNELLNTARADFEARLEMIDEKLEDILEKNVAQPELDTDEVRSIREERQSTEKCLQICAQLSEHINQIQLTANLNPGGIRSTDSGTMPGKITHEGLEECKSSLAQTALRLERYEKQLFTRLMEKLKTASASEEDHVDLTRLRDEWEATRQGMEICSKAHDCLKDSVSTIDNYATGDAVQFMVSTGEKTIHGSNRGLGWRTRQVGGHMGDETLREIARSLSSITITNAETKGYHPPGESRLAPDDRPGEELASKFRGQYGKGFKLPPEPTHPSSSGAAEGNPSRSSKD